MRLRNSSCFSNVYGNVIPHLSHPSTKYSLNLMKLERGTTGMDIKLKSQKSRIPYGKEAYLVNN